MRARCAIPHVLLACALNAAPAFADVSVTNKVDFVRRDVQFRKTAPYSSAMVVQRRTGIWDPAVEYEIARQRFHLIVPKTYSTNSDWGLFVWVSPGDDVRIPRDWEAELAKHRLLFVSAYDSGNSRPVVNRFRRALDATYNVGRQFKIDRRRIYISGLSGGSRVASVLGVAYADIFTGTLCVCGVDFYQIAGVGPMLDYPATYVPDPRILPLAKKSARFVLLTGENDFNRENTRTVLEKGFKANKFSHVLYLEVPGMYHAMPGAADLNTALEFLDGPAKKSAAPRRIAIPD